LLSFRSYLYCWQRYPGSGGQLSTDARGAIPREVQQLVVIDYRAMQNSQAAMDLRDRVMPPELKQLDEALQQVWLERQPRRRPARLCALPARRSRQRYAFDRRRGSRSVFHR
jgi:hypothetical protein